MATRAVLPGWLQDRSAPQTAHCGPELRSGSSWLAHLLALSRDAGVPPKFDFGASQNLKRAVLLWPAPQRIVEAGGSTLGFSE